MIDERILKVGIEVNGELKVYEGFELTASGTKFANQLQADCTATITNVNKDTLNFILSETSPFNQNKTPKKMTVDAGRTSTGSSRIFTGNIVSATVSNPPDVKMTIKALTANYAKTDIISTTQSASSSVSRISKDVASSLGIGLDFQATDKQISNYSFSGASLKQVGTLNDLGQINAFIDDDKLIVKNVNQPLGRTLTVVSEATGMIGIPQLTEHGIKVTILYDGVTKLGGLIRVDSKIYTSLNGEYTIYKLSYDLTNRDTAFYLTLECSKNGE